MSPRTVLPLGRLGLLVPLLHACLSTQVDTPRPPIEVEYGKAEATILTPFPSDRYTVPDPASPTGLRVKIDTTTTADALPTTFPAMAAQLGELDGFSTLAGVSITFDGPIDARGIAPDPSAEVPVTEPPAPPEAYTRPGATMYLVDVDPASRERGKLVGLIPKYLAKDADLDGPKDYTLVAEPVTPLRPRTRYLFCATNKLKAKGGGAVKASAEMRRAVLSPSNAYERKLSDGLAVLASATQLSKHDVVVATVFTTETVHDAIAGMARRTREGPPPSLDAPWAIERPIEPDGRARFKATLRAPEYRFADTGKWRVNAGLPEKAGDAAIEVFLSFADARKSGKRPVVIYQHGLGGDKDGGWGTTQRLAELDVAVIAIDSPEHGARAAPGEKDPFVAISRFLGVDIAKKTFDIAKARDNFRQVASDQLELVRLIGSLEKLDLLPVGAPDGVPDLDVSRILYIGHSFGAVQGATIFAIAPEISQAVWNVGGANLTVLMRDSPLFGVLLKGLKPPGTGDGLLARFFVVAQALVDPGDPAAFGRYATIEPLDGVKGWRPRDVLLQEVVNDGIVPNSSTAALARAAGMVQVDPIVPIPGMSAMEAPAASTHANGGTVVLTQFDRIHGKDVASHGELIFSPEGRRQYLEFFRSGLAERHATVNSSYP